MGLVYIGKVITVEPIANADRIERLDVVTGHGGKWSGIAVKDQFQVEDSCQVYLQDSIVPVTPEFAFMERHHYRVRMVRLRGVPSECLIMPQTLPGEIGDDVTEVAGVTKYEKPLPAGIGDIAGHFPSFIPKTDEPLFQQVPQMVQALYGKPFYATIKADGCLLYKTYVDLWGGGRDTIGHIVNKRKNIVLVGVSNKGEYVPSEIVGWFNNGIKNNWLTVSFLETGQKRYGWRSRNIKITSNHPVMVERDGNTTYILAKELRHGDILSSPVDSLSESVSHLIMSSMLGDGYIAKVKNKNTYFGEGHTEKHSEYLSYISRWLGVFLKNTSRKKSGYGDSVVVYVRTKSYCIISDMRKLWYLNDKKVVPLDLSWMDDFSVAKWYMDDGSIHHHKGQRDRARFATNAFSREDVDRLVMRLENMYKVNCSVTNERGWTIHVNTGTGNSIERFWSAITPHIVPCMRYKLPIEYREFPYVEYVQSEYQKYYEDRKVIVDSISYLEMNKRNHLGGLTGYDMETTTGNFVANGIVVHNSSSTIYNWQGHFGVCSRNYEIKPSDYGTLWRLAHKYHLDQNLPDGYAVQGEVVGPGIQSNPLGLKEVDFLAFNVYNIAEKRYLDIVEMTNMTDNLGLSFVSTVRQTDTCGFNLDADGLRKLAEQQVYPNGKPAEGIVVRPLVEQQVIVDTTPTRLSFKVLNLLYKD